MLPSDRATPENAEGAEHPREPEEEFSTAEMDPRARNRLATLWEKFDHDRDFARRISQIMGREDGWNVPEYVVPHELRHTASGDKALDLVAAVSEALEGSPENRRRYEEGANEILEEHRIPYAFSGGALTPVEREA
ncbi:hypothetical protein NBM05_09415 [Rothia sp. AR01]|uniref:Uncharacterized protein n=1 Tax=Rothia santali TaxID=2949643 RepID=A0A9X2KIV2_9MICC|nr:hypothetical protein [Rothia santali]MCP3426219.1 hypothetical protein [Rothia santali]